MKGVYPLPTRFCLGCMAFSCEHMLILTEHRPPYLNYQEVRLLRLLASPAAPLNKEAAEALGLSAATVKVYLCLIGKSLRKAGFPDVRHRVGLAAWAFKHLPADLPEEATAEPEGTS